jgi:alpha-amylase
MTTTILVTVLLALAMIIFIYRNIELTKQAEEAAQNTPSVGDTEQPLKTPDWVKNAVVYQVNIRTFSPEGDFKGVENHLPRLADLGVDVLWLMPIYPICVRERKCHPEAETPCLGSPYAPYDFYSVNPDFGSADDFRNFVKKSHELGMKVILDFVPNHTGWDSRWMVKHPEWFKRDSDNIILPVTSDQGEIWADIAQFDLSNKQLRKNWMEVHEFWVKEFDIDGYREDCAWAIAADWWYELRQRLDKIKPVYMLAEDEVHGREQFNTCFETNYGWETHHVMKQIFNGERPASALHAHTEAVKQKFGTRGWQLNFTQNHDENTWKGTEKELFGAGADTFFALCFAIEGMPLIYSGQEAGLDKRLWFFNKDEIDWSNLARTKRLVKKLVDAKHKNKALWNGEHGGAIEKVPTGADDKIYAFYREKEGNRVLGIFNLSNEVIKTNMASEKVTGFYHEATCNCPYDIKPNGAVNLMPYEFLLLCA